MKTALLIEILQIVGGLAIVLFAGRRLYVAFKKPSDDSKVVPGPGNDTTSRGWPALAP